MSRGHLKFFTAFSSLLVFTILALPARGQVQYHPLQLSIKSSSQGDAGGGELQIDKFKFNQDDLLAFAFNGVVPADTIIALCIDCGDPDLPAKIVAFNTDTDTVTEDLTSEEDLADFLVIATKDLAPAKGEFSATFDLKNVGGVAAGITDGTITISGKISFSDAGCLEKAKLAVLGLIEGSLLGEDFIGVITKAKAKADPPVAIILP